MNKLQQVYQMLIESKKELEKDCGPKDINGNTSIEIKAIEALRNAEKTNKVNDIRVATTMVGDYRKIEGQIDLIDYLIESFWEIVSKNK